MNSQKIKTKVHVLVLDYEHSLVYITMIGPMSVGLLPLVRI